MVVYTLGSDSGFGIGHDGIPDDYDDETGISVILWCIIFVFLLIVTIWFYITQLMPHGRTRCEVDEDEDEDERVANRLLDPKTVEKTNYEFPSCEPSTSNENAQDYEVIDGEIRIHYSNYEREAGANGNKAEPKETSTNIPRRHSMEEMSLIFPGFLPIISEEEEEEYVENIDLNKDQKVYKSSNQEGDTIENNVNTFIEQRRSSESNNFESENNTTLYLNTAAICASSTGGKGKQPVGNATMELRRRNCHQENKSVLECLAIETPANGNYAHDSERRTAVQNLASNPNGSVKVEKTSHTNLNINHRHFISGSRDFDPENLIISNVSCAVPNTLIIAEESTVALETLSQDANENTNAANLTPNDTQKISVSAKTRSVVESRLEKDSVLITKSRGLIQGVSPVVSKENIGIEIHSKDNALVPNDCETSSINMADQLTHAWTFYAVSDETANLLNGSREDSDEMDHQHQKIPGNLVDSYQVERRCMENDGNIGEHSLWKQEHGSVDAFETDIDVDDIDLDELEEDPEGHLNCFFKRHVSVTDLDKILSSQEMLNDGVKQYKDELDKESDIDEIMQGLTEPFGKTNKEYIDELISSSGDQKNANGLEISRVALKDELSSNNNINMDQVSNCSENLLTKTPPKSVIPDGKVIKEGHIDKLKTKQRNSSVNCVESSDDNAKFGNFSMRDFQAASFDKKQLDLGSHAKNYFNTMDKNIDFEIDTTENVIVSKDRPIKGESKKDVYSYKTNSENIRVLESKRSKKSQVENSGNESSVDVNRSNVKNHETENVDFAQINNIDKRVKEEITKSWDNTNQLSSKKGISAQKVGLTTDELSKIDLSRPVYSSHRDEIIIGKKKLRKDSGSKPFTTGTSRNTDRHARTDVTKEKDHVTQSLETKEADGKNLYKTKTDAINLASKEICYLEKDPNSHYHVEKRKVDKLPSIEKSVVLIPDKKQLQTLITIKDIPDTNIGLEISTNRPFEITTQKKTGMEKAEEIVASRLRRLESGKSDEKTTCIVSNERNINWDNFLVDGLALSEVESENKTDDFVHSNIELTPPTDRKPITCENGVQIKESFVSQTLCPKEIDWEWFDRDITMEEHTDDSNDTFPSLVELAEVIELNRRKISPIHDMNDVILRETNPDNVGEKIDINAKQKDKMRENDHEKDTVASHFSSCNNSEHSINENKTTGEKLYELHVVTKKEEQKPREKSASTEYICGDNDVFSNSSQPSPEPEFPVRLTKSFSELRNVELSSQSSVRDSSFSRPDRSKSQTDVFQQQESQDDVFEESDEHVFKTRITFDEVYKNRRRIVILNVRKKSPGKTRWKSLSDLDSARKHVFRFNSIGSCPEESVPAGENLSLSKPQNNEAIFAVSGRESLSTEGLHNNKASTHATVPQPQLKQTADEIMSEIDFDLNSKIQKESPESKLKLSELPQPKLKQTADQIMSEIDFDFNSKSEKECPESKLKLSKYNTTELQNDHRSKVTSDYTSLTSNSVNYKAQHEIVEPEVCPTQETVQSNIFENGERYFRTSINNETDAAAPTDSVAPKAQSCASEADSSLVQKKSSSNCLRGSTTSELETPLPRPEALSTMDGKKYESLGTNHAQEDASIVLPSNCSPGTACAVNGHSPTPSPKPCTETSLERQSSLSPTLDLTKDDPSCTSSVRSSSTPFTESTNDNKALERQSSLSPVKDLTRDGSGRRSSSGTLFAISRHSPTPMKDAESEVKPEKSEVRSPNRSSSPGTIFAVSRHSPVPLVDSEVDSVLRRQQSLSPVRDISKSRSPSGTMFAVSRHSPTVPKDSPTENHLPRQSSLSPVQDVFQRASSHRSSGTMFAISRHSPTPLSDATSADRKKVSEVTKDTNFGEDNRISNRTLAASAKSPKPYVQINKNDHKQLLDKEKAETSKKESGTSPHSISSTSSQGKSDEERPVKRELSPELKFSNQDSSSRRSSASSGYGGSRISPTSSLDWRYKTSKLSPSPEQSKETISRSSSVSSRISPTLSTDSECSNIDERKPSSSMHRRQRDSSRSGTVFAISGYSSAASDNESPRVGSRSPRGNEPKHSAKSVQKDEKLSSPRERNSSSKRQPERNPYDIKENSTIASYATTTTQNITRDKETQVKVSSISRSSSSEMENDFKISNDGWLINSGQKNRTGDQQQKTHGRSVAVTDLDSLLCGTNSTSAGTETHHPLHKSRNVQPVEVSTRLEDSPATRTTPHGVKETDLDAIFNDSDSSSWRDDKSCKSHQSSSNVDTMGRSKVFVTTSTTSINKHTVKVQSQEEVISSTSLRYDNLDEDVFTKLSTKPRSKDYNDTSFSSDADSETSSLSSIPLKPKSKNTKIFLDTVKSTSQRLSSDSSSATPSTPEKLEQELLFFHPDLTSTPETAEIRTTTNSMSREVAKKPRLEERQDKVEGSTLLTDFSYGANQVKIRSKSESQSISTGVQKSAFTPVSTRTKNRRSVSQECILDGSTADPDVPSTKSNVEDHATFKEMADSHKSMPDLHKAHETVEVDTSPEKTPYHSRLSAHTRLWLSQTAGIDTSNLCKDESVGSEIFLFPSKRFQPGRNVDASFLSIASDTEDVPDDVSSRPSSPMSEFSFSGETPFGGKFDDDLNIIACGHHLCGQEEVIRGHEKTSFTSCPSCYTYYCSRECRQAHWREHKKSCYFGRINSYMRSFVYFCHKKENLKLLLSNIAATNYASKGRGCVMVTFASPKQARKFMTSGCVLLPSPPSYPTVRELMREGVVSKHKVNLVHLVKDYDPTREFVLNLAVVAGRLDDLPRHPVPRHKLNTVLECIRVPLSQSVIKPPGKTVPDTTKETRVFYLPKCSRHEFINDMEARRHYCRNISKGLKSYGIRLKKDYPDAYESLCLYVEKNVPFKPLTVYGNEGSKIITCRIMPEASISAV